MKEYEILHFKKGDFQDSFGNYWCDMALRGVGEPVRIVVKDPRAYNEGMTIYGEIKEQTSKAGKPYLRFYRSNPDQQNHGGGTSSKSGGFSRDDAGIRAQFAIKAAIAYDPKAGLDGVEKNAIEFFKMIDRVKGEQSGYDKAKAQADKFRTNPGDTQTFSNGEPVPTEDDFASAMSNALDDGTPINLDDIPF